MATYSYTGNTVTNTASGATVKWHALLTATTTETATTLSVNYKGVFVSEVQSFWLAANRLSASLVVGGSTVASYSGPSAQTTYRSTTPVTLINYTATYQKSTAAQSKAYYLKITVASGSSWKGTSTATASTNIAIPALDDYAVTYNANGGSGSVTSQTKYYGIPLTLDDGSDLSRTNYSLLKWNTASDGSGTDYALGGSLTANADTDLYAVWHLDYIAPTVTNTAIYRVASSGSTTETDDGTYIHIGFNYVGGSLDGGTTLITPTVKVVIDGTTVYDTAQSSTSGTFSMAFGTYSKDTTHTVVVTVYDSNDTSGTSFSATVSTATYPIDLLGSGTDVYMGIMTPAVAGQVLTIGDGTNPTYINGDIDIGGEATFEDALYISLPSYSTSGTTDKEIYDAIVDLGWDTDCLTS